MNKKTWIRIFASTILLAGCGFDVGNESATVTHDFFTATLPSTSTPPPASTQLPPPPSQEIVTTAQAPIEGVTTTQLNVRSDPSTAGDAIGVVTAFSNVQILGRESHGAWFQILYTTSPEGKGWIIASYVQINGSAEIPVVEIEAGSRLGTSGLIIQGVNVRNGPGTTYDSLGTLIPNDVVSVTAKDESGKWLQIVFKGNPGWISAEYTQLKNGEVVPVVATQNEEVTDLPSATAGGIFPATIQDNDSLEVPIGVGTLTSSGASALQFSGFVSTPADEADWVQFTAFGMQVAIEVKCAGNALQMDLFKNGSILDEGLITCEEIRILNTEPGQIYTLKLTANAETLEITPYSVLIRIVR